MLYIENHSLNRALNLFLELYSANTSLLYVWVYPECKSKEVLGLRVEEINGMFNPVTTYESEKNRGVGPIPLDIYNLNVLKEKKIELEGTVDSICLYQEGSPEWVASVIGHEGIILIQNDSFFNDINNIGYKVSKEAPSWW